MMFDLQQFTAGFFSADDKAKLDSFNLSELIPVATASDTFVTTAVLDDLIANAIANLNSGSAE